MPKKRILRGKGKKKINKKQKELNYNEKPTKEGKRFTFQQGKKKITMTFKNKELQEYPYIAIRKTAYEYAKHMLNKKAQRKKLKPRDYIEYNLKKNTKRIWKQKAKQRKAKEKQKLKIIAKMPKTKNLIQKGKNTTTTTIQEIKENPNKVYNNILKKFVKHEKLIRVLQRNIQQWKDLLNTQLKIESETGQEYTGRDCEEYKGKAPEEIVQELENINVTENGLWESTTEKAMKDLGYTQIQNLGDASIRDWTIKKVLITIHFEKNK